MNRVFLWSRNCLKGWANVANSESWIAYLSGKVVKLKK